MSDRSKRSTAVLAVGSLVVLGGLIAALWSLASRTETTAEVAARARPPSPTAITVPVERRRIVAVQRLACAVDARLMGAVSLAPNPDFADVAVVTEIPQHGGASLRDGDLIIEISGRPVLAVVGELPSYRDISVGDVGPDVDQLRSFLVRLGYSPAASSTQGVGAADVEAIRALYDDRGYSPPWDVVPGETTGDEQPSATESGDESTDDAEAALGGVVWPRTEHTTVAGGVTPDYRFREGATVDGESMSLRSTDLAISCPAGVVPDATLRRGPVALARAGGPEALVWVGSDNGTATFLARDGALPTRLRRGHEVTAEVTTHRTPRAGLVVPASAVWTRADGQAHVRVRSEDVSVEVPVEIVDEADGLVMVRAVGDGSLDAGDDVEVSGSLS